MKKALLTIVLLTILTSCGPHRMKCGPGKRCVEASKKTIKNNPVFIQKKINT